MRTGERIALGTAIAIACIMLAVLGWVIAGNKSPKKANASTGSAGPVLASLSSPSGVLTSPPSVRLQPPTPFPGFSTPTPKPTPTKTTRTTVTHIAPTTTVIKATTPAPKQPGLPAQGPSVPPPPQGQPASPQPPTGVAVGGGTNRPGRAEVTSSSAGTTTATIAWQSAPDGGSPITGYVVSRDGSDTTGGGAYSTIVSPSTLSFTMTLLKPGTTYVLTVAAINAVGTGPTNGASVTTKCSTNNVACLSGVHTPGSCCG